MSKFPDFENVKYGTGFGNQVETEALPGALPKAQNTPQRCPYDLYAEQLNGTAFTAPRAANQRSWLYRIRPSAGHKPFKKYGGCELFRSNFDAEGEVDPNQLRWKPFPFPEEGKQVDFLDGIVTYGGSGGPSTKTGFAVHLYSANTDMKDKAFCNADGDMLIVPQQGTLRIVTEMGLLEVKQNEICVIQRGILFSVYLPDGNSRGYICEVFQGHFKIPDLGPIGANGNANPRDFEVPTAAFEDRDSDYVIVHKFIGRFQLSTKYLNVGQFFHYVKDHSPYDVVAWHGNYAPYKYNLDKFCAVNTVSFDHLDPSIFTVLTCQTLEPGVAVCDFVIFPPRWLVASNTFRPPYYHRNCMSEFMGLIKGFYEAKEEGFLPGGGSLHSCMTAHGPEKEVFEKASKQELKPARVADGTMAFMFESTFMMKLTKFASENLQDEDYYKCWEGLEKKFDGVDRTGSSSSQ